MSQPTPARVTFLGSGTSAGVPMIGCDCAVCRSTDPHDNRLRPSIYLDAADRGRLLVDTSTDLRQQALRHGLTRVDAILFTHAHADHVMGFDDVRRFNDLNQRRPMPCYASAATWADLRQTFHYVFGPPPQQGGGVPLLEAHTVTGPFTAARLRVVPLPVLHGRLPILGFRFGNFAYITDCSAIPDESWPLLEGVEVLVLGALRLRRHSTHFSVDEAVAAAQRLAPRRTVLTHICHDIGHAAVSATLPERIELAYDGLTLDVLVEAAETEAGPG